MTPSQRVDRPPDPQELAPEPQTQPAPPQTTPGGHTASLQEETNQIDAFISSHGTAPVREAWQRLHAALPQSHPDPAEDRESIQKRLSTIENHLHALISQTTTLKTSHGPLSYAAAAANNTVLATVAPAYRAVPTRLHREVIVSRTAASAQDRGRPIIEIV
ncbi:hypothetical protein K469DRAFT_697929 [Zopfia rhizophila CBS 207.26]|uniref:Uncharacterized protein n=1 Tax=Zopfia rhizophila CBS 207.26 TaxID=1314779 RepID=A0A6A6ELC6_9PEZI|nr:hypothetical protein K469DRAFT_697929 [Zopfia rhizophila CBS 207.26]